MLHRSLFLSTLLAATLFSSYAQNAAVTDKAEKLYELHAYRSAATEYEKINVSNPLSAKDALLWAQSLTKIGETPKALSIYKFLGNNNRLSDSAKVAYFNALLFEGNYTGAEQVANSVQNGNIAAHLKSRAEWINSNKNSAKIAVKNLALNSSGSEFGITPFRNNLVWSSDRNDIARSKSLGSKKDWTGSSNNQMFTALKTNGAVGNIQFFFTDIKNVYNEGFPSFTADGKTVAFMRSNINDGKRLLSNSGIEMSIYLADVDDNGNWMNTRPFNHNAAATGFPALSPDGKSLYYVSDRSGGFGGFDIYKSMKIGTGWTEPHNLGESINTSGDEITPSSDGENFYFASTEHNGFGGFDIFKATLSNLSDVNNIGLGINSAQDDYGYISNGKNGEAYFVSNRTGGKGREDIYQAVSHQPPPVRLIETPKLITQSAPLKAPTSYSTMAVKGKTIYEGSVMSQSSNEKLEGVTVTLFDNVTKKHGQSFTDSAGNFSASLKTTGDYTFSFYKEGFAEKKINLKGYALKSGKLPAIQLIENSVEAVEPVKQTNAVIKQPEAIVPREIKNTVEHPKAEMTAKSPNIGTPRLNKFYAVQLASSKDKFTGFHKMNDKLLALEYFVEEEGSYKVRLGVFNSKAIADSIMKLAHANNFTSAYVVEEKNDSIIDKYFKKDLVPKSYSVEVVKKKEQVSGTNNAPKPIAESSKLKTDSTFKVQIGAYKNAKNFNDDKVSNIWKVESKQDGALTVFYMDGIRKLANAKAIKKRVQEAGFKDAKVVINEGEKWKVID